MNGPHILLIIGVVALLSTTCLTMNQHMVASSEALAYSQSVITAVNLGQSLIEQAKGLRFDERVGAYPPGYYPFYFTPWWSFGEDSGDTGYDDVDDFAFYSAVDTVDGVDYVVDAMVWYVTDTMNLTLFPTYYKRLIVSVSSDALTNPVTLDYVFAYMKLANVTS